MHAKIEENHPKKCDSFVCWISYFYSRFGFGRKWESRRKLASLHTGAHPDKATRPCIPWRLRHRYRTHTRIVFLQVTSYHIMPHYILFFAFNIGTLSWIVWRRRVGGGLATEFGLLLALLQTWSILEILIMVRNQDTTTWQRHYKAKSQRGSMGWTQYRQPQSGLPLFPQTTNGEFWCICISWSQFQC